MKYTVKVKPLEKPRQWELLEDFVTPAFTVPKGFNFDGASIPLGLRWLFPHGGAKFPAACAHDYAYRTGCITKAQADLLFYRLMRENGVEEWKAKLMYIALKLFGFIAWNKRRKE